MTNNDVLRRVRYALKLNDSLMIKIFKLGGMDISKEELLGLLGKIEDDNFKKCNNQTLDTFLSGLIIFKRGKREDSQNEIKISNNSKNINNYILRKLKIALSFRSEDMLEAFKQGGSPISKGELSAIFRREEHKNYREAGDKYVRVFIKGLINMFRKD